MTVSRRRPRHLLFMNMCANTGGCVFFAMLHYRKHEHLLSSGSGTVSP